MSDPDDDFERGTVHFVKAYERVAVGWTDPRAIWGTITPEMTTMERVWLAWEHFARQWELTPREIAAIAPPVWPRQWIWRRAP